MGRTLEQIIDEQPKRVVDLSTKKANNILQELKQQESESTAAHKKEKNHSNG